MATPWCCVPGYPCRTYPDTVIPGLMALGQVCLRLAGLDSLGASQGGSAPEHDEIDQRVGAEPVSTVNRDAGCLANGHQARLWRQGRGCSTLKGTCALERIYQALPRPHSLAPAMRCR
jgi:hypothetical protein